MFLALSDIVKQLFFSQILGSISAIFKPLLTLNLSRIKPRKTPLIVAFIYILLLFSSTI